MTDLTQAQLFTDSLAHHGILGQKWGVRNGESAAREARQPEVALEVGLKGGGKLTVTKVPPSRFVQYMSRKFPDSAYAKENAAYHSFKLHNAQGEKVGDASFFQDSPTTLELEWIGVKGKHRNNGYATAALKGVISYAQDKGIQELHMTATEMGRPIYEKLGFVNEPTKHGNADGREFNAAFGMTTEMVLKIPQKQLQHEEQDLDFVKYIIDAIAAEDPEKEEVSPMTDLSHAEAFVNGFADLDSDELAHYGILGMKWGHRNAESESRESRDNRHARNTRRKLAVGTLGASVVVPKVVKAHKANQASKRQDPSDDHVISRELSRQPNHTLSNKELETINRRKQLEKTNKQLDPKGIAKGAALVGGVLAVGGLANKTLTFLNSPAGKPLVAAGKAKYAKYGLKIGAKVLQVAA